MWCASQQAAHGEGRERPYCLVADTVKAHAYFPTTRLALTRLQILTGNVALLAASKGAGLVAALAALVTMFKPQWAAATGLVFSASQGVAMAGYSLMLEVRAGGREGGRQGSKAV